ncbi:hypothetical protein HMJ29_07935 [Hymenobacter taeanensis]|uniref:Uncharacterized protein n=1 Tax=Hymenobacter taeanensis TaxID=2735321 RepID=A0A6M6BF60_9BACT|nr:MULTISPECIES: hypothetical protein [Hymenobacter]QJX46867.1 hypothetical protein HMJ29_07935 [Hymenobacter taeanensis]UOQ80739.1 hypothetical protein MUN83_18280 [Hymenobacter sp. 5414T-23]
MENTVKDPQKLPGWGIDANPENDPTYPMRERMNVSQDPDSKHRPDALQPVDIELLKTIERPNVSAVFGEAAPPTGLSGMIRRFAFNYSESHYGHWLPLLLADRVNVVEGVLEDLAHGHVPNIFAEKGYKVEWEHNRTAFVTKMATIALVTTGAILLLTRDKDKDYKRKKNSYKLR